MGGFAAADEPPSLSADHLVSDDGTVNLSWPTAPSGTAELQQSADPGFSTPVTIYRGADTGRVVTGLREGTYHFRAGNASGWSQPLTVEVRYLSRGKLVALVATGGLVASLTTGAIVLGFIRTRNSSL